MQCSAVLCHLSWNTGVGMRRSHSAKGKTFGTCFNLFNYSYSPKVVVLLLKSRVLCSQSRIYIYMFFFVSCVCTLLLRFTHQHFHVGCQCSRESTASQDVGSMVWSLASLLNISICHITSENHSMNRFQSFMEKHAMQLHIPVGYR